MQQVRNLYSLPIYRLPPELLVAILKMLSVVEFSSFTFAAYHLMRYHGIAPSYTTERIVALLSPPPPVRKLSASHGQLHKLPTELILDLMQKLDSTDSISFLFANFHLLRERNIAPSSPWGGSAQIRRAYSRWQPQLEG